MGRFVVACCSSGIRLTLEMDVSMTLDRGQKGKGKQNSFEEKNVALIS